MIYFFQMRGAQPFPTTSWSLVLGAVQTKDRRPAFERLCTLYWPPVHGFIRTQVGDEESARDLTQAFFARLLEKQDLLPADPGKTRFRSYLIGSIKHFLANERDRARTQRRGGAWTSVPLDFDDSRAAAMAGVVDDMSPEKIFEKRWAMLVVDRALATVRRQYDELGQRRQFDWLEIFLLGSKAGSGYKSIAEELGMSEAAVKMAAYRLRRRFGEALRAEISLTVSEPGEIDDELRYLLAVLST